MLVGTFTANLLIDIVRTLLSLIQVSEPASVTIVAFNRTLSAHLVVTFTCIRGVWRIAQELCQFKSSASNAHAQKCTCTPIAWVPRSLTLGHIFFMLSGILNWARWDLQPGSWLLSRGKVILQSHNRCCYHLCYWHLIYSVFSLLVDLHRTSILV